MKIAVAFWGTQKYLNYLPEWYDRIEKYFLPGVEKKYFILTDGQLENCPENIVKVTIPDYGFPETFDKTFEEFLKLEEECYDCDWFISIDSDLHIWKTIEYSDFFDDSKKYIGVHHPCHYLGFGPHDKVPGSYDVNPLSNACITEDLMDMGVYYQGCLWGGKVPYIFDMMRVIDDWTKNDLKKGIRARYFEESYMNKWYLMNKEETHTLHPSFAFPELYEEHCDFERKMVHRKKDNKSLGNTLWN